MSNDASIVANEGHLEGNNNRGFLTGRWPTVGTPTALEKSTHHISHFSAWGFWLCCCGSESAIARELYFPTRATTLVEWIGKKAKL